MTAATPLLVADILSTASSASPTNGAATQGDDLLAASSFAALLHIANFVSDAPAHTVQTQLAVEPSANEPQEAPPIDGARVGEGLLFLSSVMPAVAAIGAMQHDGNIAARSRPALAALANATPAESSAVARLVPDATASVLPPAMQPLLEANGSSATTQAAQTDAATSFGKNADATPVQKTPESIADANVVALVGREESRRSVEPTPEAVTTVKASPSPIGMTIVSSSNAPSAPSLAPAIVVIETLSFERGWHDEVAHRVAALTVRGAERAELRLSPAELGPVEVRINLRDREATLSILAVNPLTRDALEQALPALRDMLAQQSISLGETSVRDGCAEDAPARHDAPRAERSSGNPAARTSDGPALTVARLRRLVDVFA